MNLTRLSVRPLSRPLSRPYPTVRRASLARVAALAAALVATLTAHGEAFAKAPATLVPADAQPVTTLSAAGVQIYSCEYDKDRHLGWVFKSPSATLYDGAGHAAVVHSAGPSWQAEDGSRVIGHALASAPSETAQSVPQLLLRAEQAGGVGSGGLLSGVRYVQRLDTVGGAMPPDACTTEHQIGNSPYLAHYVFLK